MKAYFRPEINCAAYSTAQLEKRRDVLEHSAMVNTVENPSRTGELRAIRVAIANRPDKSTTLRPARRIKQAA